MGATLVAVRPSLIAGRSVQREDVTARETTISRSYWDTVLGSLPVEVLDLITDELDRKDIQSLGLGCKFLYAAVYGHVRAKCMRTALCWPLSYNIPGNIDSEPKIFADFLRDGRPVKRIRFLELIACECRRRIPASPLQSHLLEVLPVGRSELNQLPRLRKVVFDSPDLVQVSEYFSREDMTGPASLREIEIYAAFRPGGGCRGNRNILRLEAFNHLEKLNILSSMTLPTWSRTVSSHEVWLPLEAPLRHLVLDPCCWLTQDLLAAVDWSETLTRAQFVFVGCESRRQLSDFLTLHSRIQTLSLFQSSFSGAPRILTPPVYQSMFLPMEALPELIHFEGSLDLCMDIALTVPRRHRIQTLSILDVNLCPEPLDEDSLLLEEDLQCICHLEPFQPQNLISEMVAYDAAVPSEEDETTYTITLATLFLEAVKDMPNLQKLTFHTTNYPALGPADAQKFVEILKRHCPHIPSIEMPFLDKKTGAGATAPLVPGETLTSINLKEGGDSCPFRDAGLIKSYNASLCKDGRFAPCHPIGTRRFQLADEAAQALGKRRAS